MTLASATHTNVQFEDMAWPLTMSSILHLCLLVLVIIGLPHVTPELPVIENVIAVEIVEMEKKPENEEPTRYSRKAKVPENNKRDNAKKSRPMPPKVTAKKPPRPITPMPPELSEEVAMQRDAEKLKEREKSLVKPRTIPKKPARKPMLIRDDEPQEKFLSVLKNLQDQNSPPPSEESETLKSDEKQPLMGGLGKRMTLGEQSAFLNQLAMCWNVAAGARYAEDIVVKVKIVVNPDRTVRDARIVDQSRYNRDSFFRAAADAALRAINNPRCTPLDLPLDKYNQWRNITINFDPKEML